MLLIQSNIASLLATQVGIKLMTKFRGERYYEEILWETPGESEFKWWWPQLQCDVGMYSNRNDENNTVYYNYECKLLTHWSLGDLHEILDRKSSR